MFQSAKAASTFAFAGRATITLKSVKTGTHFTFKIAAPIKNPNNVLFVSVLCGPDSYRYVGMLDASRVFRTTGKSVSGDAKSASAFRYFAENLAKDCIPESLEVRHDGRCGVCARQITTPSSLDSGIGPDCAERLGIAVEKPKKVRVTHSTNCDHGRWGYPFGDCNDADLRNMRRCSGCGDVRANGVFAPPTPRMLEVLGDAEYARQVYRESGRDDPEALGRLLKEFNAFLG